MTEITGTLKRWLPQMVAQTEYIILGDCYDDIHRRFPDGTPIHTSGIKLDDFPIDDLVEGMIVKTRYSTYKLGNSLL